MNEKFEKLALDAGLLNYIDNETPRECFVASWADVDEVEDYGRKILQEVFRIMQEQEKIPAGFHYGKSAGVYVSAIKNEFGIL
jgi:hypothetical protein